MTDTPAPPAEPSDEALIRPCDDENLERALVEAVKIARTSDAKYVGDLLDETSVLNIVLQITEGTTILEDLVDKHVRARLASNAEALSDMEDDRNVWRSSAEAAHAALAECRAKTIEECKAAIKPWLTDQGLNVTLQVLNEVFNALATKEAPRHE